MLQMEHLASEREQLPGSAGLRAAATRGARGFAVVLLLACAAGGCEEANGSRLAGVERTAATPAGTQAPASSTPSPEAAEVTGTAGPVSAPSQILAAARLEPAECTTDRDCSYGTIGAISDESDCACALCPAEAPAVPRALAEERRQQFAKTCREWVQSNGCPPRTCDRPAVVVCDQGKCKLQAG